MLVQLCLIYVEDKDTYTVLFAAIYIDVVNLHVVDLGRSHRDRRDEDSARGEGARRGAEECGTRGGGESAGEMSGRDVSWWPDHCQCRERGGAHRARDGRRDWMRLRHTGIHARGAHRRHTNRD